MIFGKQRIGLALTVAASVILSWAISTSEATAQSLCSAEPGGYSGYCEAPATEYVQTIVSFALRRTDGTLVTLGSTAANFDAASSSAGATVGTYLSSVTIPPGTYDAVVPTISATQTVTGSAELSDGSGDCRTTGAGAAAGAGAASSYTVTMTLAMFGGSLPSGLTFVDGGANLRIVDTTSTGLPLTVTGSETITFTLAFGTSRGTGFTYNAGTCTAVQPGPVDVTLTITTS